MRIGILTFHRAYNYGAFLQALALKKYLEKFGHTVHFIDYQYIAHTRSYDLIDKNQFQALGFRGKLSLLVKGILKAPRQWKRYSKMRGLQNRYLELKGHPHTQLEKTEIENHDLIIYGSDQIWRKSNVNPNSGFDPAYWGEGFDGIRKITYAASMGVMELSSEDKEFIKNHLKRFSKISCREENLVTELSQLTSEKIHHVIDPVFLIEKSEWEKILLSYKTTHKHKKYVLVYNLMHSEEVDKLAKRIAQERGLEVFEITGSIQPYTFDTHILQTEDAFEFLKYIHDAEFVVASSFHAIAFSIIFNVNFYAVGLNKNSERVRSLLEIANLRSRLISNASIRNIEDVDFSQINLSQEIESSKNYLNSSI